MFEKTGSAFYGYREHWHLGTRADDVHVCIPGFGDRLFWFAQSSLARAANVSFRPWCFSLNMRPNVSGHWLRTLQGRLRPLLTSSCAAQRTAVHPEPSVSDAGFLKGRKCSRLGVQYSPCCRSCDSLLDVRLRRGDHLSLKAQERHRGTHSTYE